MENTEMNLIKGFYTNGGFFFCLYFNQCTCFLFIWNKEKQSCITDWKGFGVTYKTQSLILGHSFY